MEFSINLRLTERDIEILRYAMHELGTEKADCVSLQLKVANALLSSDYRKDTKK